MYLTNDLIPSSTCSLSTTGTSTNDCTKTVIRDDPAHKKSNASTADEPKNHNNNNQSGNTTSAFVLMEQYGIDIETVTNEKWDEIMYYEAAVQRKQRRERRRSAEARRHVGEIFPINSGVENMGVEEKGDEKRE